MLGGDDEGRRLVVRIGGARADAGDEGAGRIERRAVPLARGEGDQLAPAVQRLVQQHHRIGPHQPPVVVGVAGAGAGAAGADAAEHGTGVAADDAVAFRRAELVRARFGERGSPVVMAASGDVPSFRRVPEPERLVEAVGQDGHAGDAHARRVADGAEDRGRGGDEGGLAHALRAVAAPPARGPRSASRRSPACRRPWGSGSRAGSPSGRGRTPPSARGRGPALCRRGSGLPPRSGSPRGRRRAPPRCAGTATVPSTVSTSTSATWAAKP